MSVVGEGEKGSLLWVARVRLLLCFNSDKKSGRTNYAFRRCMECTLALNQMDTEMGCVSLRWSTADYEDHRPVAGEELNNRTEMITGEWLAVEAFSAIRSIVHVVYFSDFQATMRFVPCLDPCSGRIIAST